MLQQAILTSTLLFSVGAFAFHLGNRNAVEQQDDMVQCYSESTCGGETRKMTLRECCLIDANMHSYFASEMCYQCIVYGWLEESLTMEEKAVYPYQLEVGYIKGSGDALKFRVTAQQGCAQDNVDYTFSPQQITITAQATESVEVDTYLDSVALEPDEQFQLKLELLSDPEPGFFRDSISLTIVDSDELEVSLTSVEYRASEGAKAMAIGVKKNKQIATPLGITITPQTVAQAETWTVITLPEVDSDIQHFFSYNATVIDDPQNRKNKDFDDTQIQAEFLPDLYAPVNDLTIDVSLIDDDLNEPYEEYFVVRLDLTQNDNSLVNISGPRASLCKIVDNDPIRIGFTKHLITVSFNEFTIHPFINIISEDNRLSQQIFNFHVQAVAASPSENIGVVNHRVLTAITNSMRTTVHQFNSYTHTMPLTIHLEGFDLLEDNHLPEDFNRLQHSVAFELVISGAWHAPYFLQADKLFQSIFIIIQPN